MGPNTQRYDYSYRYTHLCSQPKKEDKKQKKTIYSVLKEEKFTRIFDAITISGLAQTLSNDVHTLFVTSDEHIPDIYTKDKLAAEILVSSYMLPGVADVAYLKSNGSAVYLPRRTSNPIFVQIHDNGNIIVNRVGKIERVINTENGNIIVVSDLATVL